jgi:ComEC/Rec2-related protein
MTQGLITPPKAELALDLSVTGPKKTIKPLNALQQLALVLQSRQHVVCAVALMWALGIWVGQSASTGITPWPWLALTLGLTLLCKRLWLMQGMMLLGSFWLAVAIGQPATALPPLGQVRATGWLIQPRLFHVDRVEQADQPGLATLTVRLAKALPEGTASGQSVTLTGECRMPFGSALPGTFNEQAYLTGLNAKAVLKPEQITPLVNPEASSMGSNVWAALYGHTAAMRQLLATELKRTFAANDADRALMGGLLLGDDALPLPKPYEQALLSTGLLHVVSASGANLMMMAGLLLLLCRSMPNRWVRRGFLVLGVTGYAWLTGFPPSIQRAYAVLAVGTVLKWAGLPLQPITLLMLAVAGLLTVVPWLSQSVGFQLSVLATSGIVWLVPKMTHNRPGWWLWFAVPLAAELAVLPWSSTLFHQWSWAALPMNVLVDGLLLPLTWLASLGGLACGIGLPMVGQWLWLLATPLLWLFNTAVYTVNQWPGVMQTVPQWPAASLVSWYALLALGPLVKAPYRKPAWALGLMGVTLPWLLTLMLLHLPHTRHVMLDDGQRLTAVYNGTNWCLRKPADWPAWRQRSLPDWLQGQGIPRHTIDKPCDGQNKVLKP